MAAEPNLREQRDGGVVTPAELLALGLGLASTPSGRDLPAMFETELGEFLTAKPDLELYGCLGFGGMGVVYRARQVRLARDVAVKLMSPELGRDLEFASRFETEARALARLDHPGIVRVHEFGEAAGLYYLIMELVDGPNLRELASEGLSDEQTLEIVTQLCDALAYAHEQGVVHRDIKPENVLIDRRGRVRLADFGLAKLQHDLRPTAARTRRVMGTPQYMAPEQLGQPDSVDQRCDIFALGVVLYEMLTGQLPVGRFPPPSELGCGDERLDEVILRALESRRERRYQTVEDFRSALATATTDASTQPTAPAPRRWWGLASLAVAAGVAALVGVWNWQRAPDPAPRIEAPAVVEQEAGTKPEVETKPDVFKQLNRWPARELAALDPDLVGVVGVDWSELRQAPLVVRLSSDLIDKQSDMPEGARLCKESVVDRIDKLLVAFDAEAPRELVIRGEWEPGALDRCIDALARTDPGADARVEDRMLGRFRQLVFLDRDGEPVTATLAGEGNVVLISLRPDISEAELEAKLAGEPNSVAFRDRVLARVDLSSPIWFAADAPAGTMPFGTESISGGIELWNELAVDATASFVDVDAAAEAKTLIESYVVVAKAMLDLKVPPELVVEQRDDQVHVRGSVEVPELQGAFETFEEQKTLERGPGTTARTHFEVDLSR